MKSVSGENNCSRYSTILPILQYCSALSALYYSDVHRTKWYRCLNGILKLQFGPWNHFYQLQKNKTIKLHVTIQNGRQGLIAKTPMVGFMPEWYSEIGPVGYGLVKIKKDRVKKKVMVWTVMWRLGYHAVAMGRSCMEYCWRYKLLTVAAGAQPFQNPDSAGSGLRWPS